MTDLLPAAVAQALSCVAPWSEDHFLTGLEPGLEGHRALLDLAVAVRSEQVALARSRPLAGRVFAGMFFDPSLRTRASMAVACGKLGAQFLELQPGTALWTLEFKDEVVMDGSAAEHVREAAAVLGRYADIVGLRAFPTRGQWERERTQPVHQAFAAHAGVPLVNLEGPFAHPCQGLADALTLRDLFEGDPSGRKFVLSWAPHPKQLPLAVPHSALWAAASQGMEVVVAHPEDFDLDREALTVADGLARDAGGSLSVTHDRGAALEGADVVYAKAWGAVSGPASTLGGHADAIASHKDWRITEADLRRGAPARFLHCLPVRRGVVVDDAVLDGELSSVLDQAENRVWAQAALLMAMVRR